MKVALFGGTFDPVHLGHVNAAKEVLRQGLVEEVWLVPVQWHAFKKNSGITELRHRRKMIELAIEGIPGLKVLDLEENPTYTVDTIRQAKKMHPGKEFLWLMGTNLVEEFSSWRNPEEILHEAKLILFPVPGSEDTKNALIDSSSPIRVKAKAIDLSSTAVRERLAKGLSVKGLVPEKVLRYIEANRLYGI